MDRCMKERKESRIGEWMDVIKSLLKANKSKY